MKCPNSDSEHSTGCKGEIVFLKKPFPILYLIPEDLLELLEGKDTPEEMYGYVLGFCPECGFILCEETKDEGSFYDCYSDYLAEDEQRKRGEKR